MEQRVNGFAGGAAGTAPLAVNNNELLQQPHDTAAPGFHKAIKSGGKARVALVGVSGSGKSYTLLILARALAGPQGKIACIDTINTNVYGVVGTGIDGRDRCIRLYAHLNLRADEGLDLYRLSDARDEAAEIAKRNGVR